MKKTIKIPQELHHDLMKLKVEYNLPTLSSVIRFLELFHKEYKNDQSKK